MSYTIYPSRLESLYEKAGVWNYVIDPYTTENDFNAHMVNKIYSYLHDKIIELSNNNVISSTYDIEIPANLLYNNMCCNLKGKQMLPLTIIYHTSLVDNNLKMNTVYKRTKIVINSYISITNKEFKTIFFHEMKHYWQYNFSPNVFQDLSHLKILNNYDVSQEVRCLSQLVYMNNPSEFQAFLEQIYNISYMKTFSNQDVSLSDIIESIKQYMFIDKISLKTLFGYIEQNNVDVEKYLIELCLSNVNEIFRDGEYIDDFVHLYRLFSKDIYDTEIVKKYKQEIANIVTDSDKAIDCISRYVEEIYKDKELFNKIKTIFVKRIKYYIKNNTDKLTKVCYNAYSDAQKNLSKENIHQRLNSNSLFNYITIYNHIYGIDFVVVDLKTNEHKIITLKADNVFKIYKKYILLITHLKNKCQMYFLIYNVFDKIFSEYISYCDFSDVEDLELPEYNSINDIIKIVDMLNKYNDMSY